MAPADMTKQDKIKYKVDATPEQIAEAPAGSLGHRIWKCQADFMVNLKRKWAAPDDVVTTSQSVTERAPGLGKSASA